MSAITELIVVMPESIQVNNSEFVPETPEVIVPPRDRIAAVGRESGGAADEDAAVGVQRRPRPPPLFMMLSV